MSKWLMKWLKKKITEEMTSNAGVKPSHSWSAATRKFFLNSEAGLLIYKPKDEKDLMDFRNTYLNRFDALRSQRENLQDVSKELFELYFEIRKAKRVKYLANTHTRLRGRVLCALPKST